MKTFDFDEGLIEAKVQTKAGEMVNLVAKYPSGPVMASIQKREAEKNPGYMGKTVGLIFGIEKLIESEQITFNQIANIYNWFFTELQNRIASVPPGDAKK